MRALITVEKDPKNILRTPCKPVKKVSPEVESLIADLIDYMYNHREDGIAPISMAAPQLGGLIRVIVFYPNPFYREKNGIEVLINPELTSTRDFILLNETCISMPGKAYTIRRAKRVKVKGTTIEGRPKSYKASDLFAQAIQHEMNHLDGVLMDKVGQLRRD